MAEQANAVTGTAETGYDGEHKVSVTDSTTGEVSIEERRHSSDIIAMAQSMKQKGIAEAAQDVEEAAEEDEAPAGCCGKKEKKKSTHRFKDVASIGVSSRFSQKVLQEVRRRGGESTETRGPDDRHTEREARGSDGEETNQRRGRFWRRGD